MEIFKLKFNIIFFDVKKKFGAVIAHNCTASFKKWMYLLWELRSEYIFFLGYVTQITLAVAFGVIIAQKVSSNFW